MEPQVLPDPTIVQLAEDMRFILTRAYLEQVSRTEPKAFLKFAADVLRMRSPDGNGRGNMVVNVVNAIPRSPLDGLPPGFTLK
jgi:hypothetical protein